MEAGLPGQRQPVKLGQVVVHEGIGVVVEGQEIALADEHHVAHAQLELLVHRFLERFAPGRE
jgi:hypothetical protein